MVDKQVAPCSHGEAGHIGFVPEVARQRKKSPGKSMMAGGENHLHRQIPERFLAGFQDNGGIEGRAGSFHVEELAGI